MVQPPTRPSSHADTDIDCQAAIEPEFQALVGKAVDAGWSGETTARAMLALAMAHIKARIGKAQVERAIREARKSVEQ